MALSKATHALLDLATPALAAILWYGSLPRPYVLALGLLTAFAGYTAVYAVNDLVDCKDDKKRIEQGGLENAEGYLDSVYVRHPLARGLLSHRQAVSWAGGWALVALGGAYFLNPVCALMFIAGVLFETIYCVMLKVSHLRVFVSGVVKTLGALAAVLAVDSNPSPVFMVALFSWLFLWEIGGQNMPCDWYDLEEDGRLDYKTLPVKLGPQKTGNVILAILALIPVLSLVLFRLAPRPLSLPAAGACFIAGVYLLVLPALRCYRTPSSLQVANLFNRASSYPLALLCVAITDLLV